jgi:hypothetical protein
MSEYSARQEAWMARVAAGTPVGYEVSLGWPREAYSRPVKGHWKCHECKHEWLEYTTGAGTFTEDDFIEESCEECSSLNTHLTIEDDWQPDSEDESDEFSWASCDLCNSHLGGSRHNATFFPDRSVPVRDLIPIAICVDCLMFCASGDVPEDEYLTWV